MSCILHFATSHPSSRAHTNASCNFVSLFFVLPNKINTTNSCSRFENPSNRERTHAHIIQIAIARERKCVHTHALKKKESARGLEPRERERDSFSLSLAREAAERGLNFHFLSYSANPSLLRACIYTKTLCRGIGLDAPGLYGRDFGAGVFIARGDGEFGRLIRAERERERMARIARDVYWQENQGDLLYCVL